MKIAPDFKFETKYKLDGYKCIAGVDEVGRGAWAGPVYVAAVVLPEQIDRVFDSKMLSPRARELAAEEIKQKAVYWSVAWADVCEIDQLGIHQATFLAFRRAISKLENADFVLVDGFKIPDLTLPQLAISKGDQKSCTIAAASIIAKVERDNLMCELANQYPHYGFDQHKGYGTKLHMAGLDDQGPCQIHRRSYAPIARYFK